MTVYVLTCTQDTVPDVSVVGAASSQVCTGTVGYVEYTSSIFVPLSVADSMQITGAMALLWGAAWLFRHLTFFISTKGNSHEIET
ncbi:hypothetical protein [Collimonas arenae]|uniref:hypothetical protein n=1 Tax=Collimonas arenae TaxID=279058 RepID=UPI0012E043C4|nr:hypothetical protein [Collimonas arenae]